MHELSPVPFREIHKKALEYTNRARKEGIAFSAGAKTAWANFSTQLQSDGEFWTGTLDDFHSFWKLATKADELLTPEGTSQLRKGLVTHGPESDDWYSLAGFLLHDVNHLRPIFLFSLLGHIEGSYVKAGKFKILAKHKTFFDTVADRLDTLATVPVYPLEFVGNVATMQDGLPITQQNVRSLELLEKIAFLIKGRFCYDDYDIHTNESSANVSSNNIHIACPPDLIIPANEAMIFGVVYNLAKNAAKANAIKHYEENGQLLMQEYFGKGALKTPRSLSLEVSESEDAYIFVVGDEGDGLSVDGFLKRMQSELQARLRTSSVAEIRNSEWYWALKKVLGEEQTEYFLAWPTEPNALRKLTLGTIFDAQFVAGFSGMDNELRSYTSGMGLWGVRYITEYLGGTVMGTNRFDGGAQFSFAIPKTAR